MQNAFVQYVGCSQILCFVVDNENYLIIKSSCFFTTKKCATYGMVWLEYQFLSHTACFLCLESKAQITEPCGNFKWVSL